MGGMGKYIAGVLLAAVFVLAYRLVPVRLEEEHVRAEAGILANRIIVVDGAYGGFGGVKYPVAGRLVRWLAPTGAMVVLSGDLEPALAAYGGFNLEALERDLADRSGAADLLVSVRPGAAWRITYPETGQEQQLAEDLQREISLVETGNRPALVPVSGRPPAVPWVRVEIPALDNREQDNLAWAVYAGIVNYFAEKPPAVNVKVLQTLEHDIPTTVNSP